MRRALPLLVALPALLSGLLGLAHPVFLTPETAQQWLVAHLLLLPVFPLLAASLLWLVRGDGSPWAWAARGLALVWALLYTALDAIAGVGAGAQMLRTSERGDPRPPVEDLFAIGDQLGRLGAYAFLVAGLLTACVVWRRTRSRLAVAGGLLVVVGAQVVQLHHVFPPRGVGGALAIAVGLALLAVADGRRRG